MTEADPATPTVPPPAKKARKPRAKPPAAPKVEKPPRAPRDTIHAWIRQQGAAHVEAARILGTQFVKDLRAEFARFDAHAAAAVRVAALKIELAIEEKALAAMGSEVQPMPHKDRLNDLAVSIAKARAGSLNAEAPLLAPDGRDEGAET